MSSAKPRSHEVLIVGGGQAGLAASYHLKQRGIDHLVIDRHRAIGEAWSTRWTSLRLFSPNRWNRLPGLPFPGDPSALPTKDDVARHLQEYASEFSLPVSLECAATSLSRSDQLFVCETAIGTIQSRAVIVATGPFQRPEIPAFAAQLSPSIVQIHSSDYVEPSRLPPGDVLVVGTANSGAQIALEIAGERNTVWAGRAMPSLPRSVFGVDIFDLFSFFGLADAPTDSIRGRSMRRRQGGGDPLIGLSMRDVMTQTAGRLRHVGRVQNATSDALLCDDGSVVKPDVVVWGTGYRSDYRWIHLPVCDARGDPIHRDGKSEEPGLYFLGLRWLRRANSSLLGGVGEDAAAIVDELVRSVLRR